MRMELVTSAPSVSPRIRARLNPELRAYPTFTAAAIAPAVPVTPSTTAWLLLGFSGSPALTVTVSMSISDWLRFRMAVLSASEIATSTTAPTATAPAATLPPITVVSPSMTDVMVRLSAVMSLRPTLARLTVVLKASTTRPLPATAPAATPTPTLSVMVLALAETETCLAVSRPFPVDTAFSEGSPIQLWASKLLITSTTEAFTAAAPAAMAML